MSRIQRLPDSALSWAYVWQQPNQLLLLVTVIITHFRLASLIGVMAYGVCYYFLPFGKVSDYVGSQDNIACWLPGPKYHIDKLMRLSGIKPYKNI